MSANLIGHTLLNQYRVDAFVGSGGMGIVYRVWDLKRNVPLAMKVLHADLADDPSVYKRFKREANALKKLAHPNIVPFYGVEQDRGTAFLLERFVDGPTLKELLKKLQGTPMPIKEALTYLKILSAALGYAHANGVVHCDVKPDNVMVDQGGHIYLTDFGIARHAESTTTTLGTAGTPAYMAPEQIRGEAVTPATDVYALGVMLFEMLTGQRPFRGDEKESESSGATAAERIRYGHVALPPPDPRLFNPDLPEELAGVILKSLGKIPYMRYENTQTLFSACCDALGINPTDIPDRIYSPDSIKVEKPVSVLIPDGRKRIGLLVVGGGGLVVILLFLIFRVWDRGGQNPLTPIPTAGELVLPAVTSTQTAILVTEPGISTDTVTPLPTNTITPMSSLTPTIVSSWKQGKLAFVAGSDWDTSLYILDLTRNENPELIYSPVSKTLISAPSWSPNSSKISFQQYEGGNWVVYVIEPKPQASARRLYDCSVPSWSPDSNQILCKSNGLNVFNIIDVSSGKLVTSFDGRPGSTLPSWSPLGDEMVYVIRRENLTQVWLSTLSEGSLPTMLAGTSTENYAPSWSPDGQWIAFQSNQGRSLSDIWIVDRNGANIKNVLNTNSRYWSRAPAWSPDGQWLAFVSDQEGSNGVDFGEILVVSLKSREVQKITTTGGRVYDWRVSWGK